MRTPWIALAAIGLVACESVESDDVLTDGMYANIHVTTEGTGDSVAQATLRVGGATSNTFVDLVGDDALTVSVGAITEDMDKVGIGDLVSYQATVPHDAAGDTWTIAFTRTVDAGAPNTTISLPEPFVLEPIGGDFSEDTVIDVTWSPSGSSDTMEVVVDGDCIFQWTGDITGDPGVFAIDGADIEPVNDDPGTSCAVDVTLRRVAGGTLDPGYGEGGVAIGVQQRSTEVTWTQ